MDSFKDIYDDFFADVTKLQQSNQKRIDKLNQTLYGENGILKDTPLAKQGGRKTPKTPGSDPALDFYGNMGAGKSSGSGRTGSPEDALKLAQDALNDAKSMIDQLPGTPPAGTSAENLTATATAAEAESGPKEPEKDPEEELDELIGLADIKSDVRELAAFAKVQKIRKEQGMKSVPVSLHLVFTGNPGTGKTTVARILGRMYKKIGILSKGQLVEVDRSGLVAGYVGQTALKVQKVIQSAMGGVLFIDEAYALSQENDAFGQEAIDTLLKAMEDHRDNLIVIIAGYTEPMEVFINSNPGLKSRFNKYIEFPDYTVDELEQIFDLNCRKYEYEVDEDAKTQIRAMITLRKIRNLVNFANGRDVRNLFEEIITNQARRIAKLEDPKPEDLRRITVDDLRDDGEEKADGEKKEGSESEEGKAAEEKTTEEKAAEEPSSEEKPAEEKHSAEKAAEEN